MSFYDDASLVLIPSAQKTSKVYSVKPTDGTGDLTFTRASTATRVNSSGLIEEVRTNVLTYSQTFSDASWLVDPLLTRTLNQTDPNGGTTAALYTATSGTNLTLGKNVTLVANAPNTVSIYIKGNASGSVSLRIDDSTLGPQTNINYTTNWQRFSVTRTVNQASCAFVVGGFSSWGTGENLSFAFAQAEAGDIATAYIPTTTAAVSVGPVANVPRLDYLGSTCPRLLLEPQRTNLLQFSEQFNNAYWSLSGATITSNTTVAPDGTQSSDTLTGVSGNFRVFRLVSGLTNIDYSFSVFVKQGTSNTVNLDFVNVADGPAFNFTTKTFTTVSGWTTRYEEHVNGWFRLFAKRVSNTSSAGLGIKVSAAGQTVFIWGAQMEEGSYGTSYIPTPGASSVTRVADAVSKTGISSLIGQTEGTLFAEIYPEEFVNGSYIGISDGTSTNRIIFGFEGGAGNLLVFGNTGLSGSGTYTRGQKIKIAIAYKSGSSALYVNGTLTSTSNNAFTASYSQFNFNSGTGIQNFFGKCAQALLFKTRLTNAQLAELTTL